MGLTFNCAKCGDVAATVELTAPRPTPTGPDDIGYDQWKLRINGPVDITYWVLRSLEELKAALRQGTVAALLDVNPDYVNWWCPHCLASYCKEHWYPVEPEMDEGFYDATYGTCPNGHRVMLDD